MEKLYQEAIEKYKKKEEISNMKSLIKQTKYSPSTDNEPYKPYPSITNSEFQKKIYSKKDFHKNKYKPIQQNYEGEVEKQCSKKIFQMMEHQKFLKNYLSPYTPYNSILLFHSVGSGKSCTAINIAQQYSNVFKKKHLVLVSQNLKENFKKQIFDIEKVQEINNKLVKSYNQCTGTKYLDLITDYETTPKEVLNKKIKKIIQEEFEFKTYMEFSTDYTKLQKDSEQFEKNPEKQRQRFEDLLKENYSDRVIIVDEVHNLRLSSAGTEKIVPPKIEHMLRVTNNVKLVLLTATPMFNQAEEIIWILNLMILNDGYKSIDIKDVFKDNRLTENGKTILVNASQGRISYVRGENPYAFPARLYPNDDKILTEKDKPRKDIFGMDIKEKNTLEQMHLVKSYMSEEQLNVYSKVEELYEKHKTDILSNENNGNVNGESVENNAKDKVDIQMGMQISNVIFPSNKDDLKSKYGFSSNLKHERGFNQCFEVISDASMFKVRYQIKEQIFSPTSLQKYAPKLQTIIDYIENAEGIVYIYSNYIYSGIIPLAIALEHLGYKKYGGNTILEGGTKKKPNNKQFIILSANSKLSSNNDAEIEKVKSDKNKDGDIIKVILASNVATEGLDFKNIREIHILEPWYHMQKLEQIIGRGLRYCSHIGLPLEKRNVTLYHHVNVKNKDMNKETIDVRVYRIANTKQDIIKEVGNILKQNAVDCLLNKEITYYDPKKVNKKIALITSQGEEIKNYALGDNNDVETFTCINQQLSDNIKINDSTFKQEFFEDDSQIYIYYISLLYTKKLSYTYSEIRDILRNNKFLMEDDVLKYSLEKMLRNKIILYNSNKEQGYLIYRGQYYIFQSNDKKNMRMTMDERNNANYLENKKRLNMKKFNELLKTNTKNVVHRNVKSSSAVEKIDVTKIEKHIEEAIKTIQNVLNKCIAKDDKTTLKEYTNVFIDYAIDRLTENELFLLMNKYIFADKDELKDEEKLLLESLKNSKLLYYNKDKVSFYVNMFRKADTNKRYWIVKKNTLVPISIVDKDEYIEHENKLKKQIKSKYTTVEGFVSHKNERCIFKSIDQEAVGSSGSICMNDSKIKVRDLEKKLHIYDEHMIFNKVKIIKPELCELYELILRKTKPTQFLRPYEYELWKKMK
jgi:hypothetical protein